QPGDPRAVRRRGAADDRGDGQDPRDRPEDGERDPGRGVRPARSRGRHARDPAGQPPWARRDQGPGEDPVPGVEPYSAGGADGHVDCKAALNPVKNMMFSWSLNPYTGCEHRCAFCYVRAFELRADRPSDDRYGRSIRVKINVAGVLRSELGRRSWKRETVVIGAATDPYQPAEGRFRLTRQCLEVLRDFANPAAMITRGPMIVRDIDVLSELARRADLHITFSVPTIDDDIWRNTQPGPAHPRRRPKAP